MTVITASVDTFTRSNSDTVLHVQESKEELVTARKVYLKFIIVLAVVLLLFTTASSNTFAKSWRGITPLHSTVHDVRKLFPACEEKETGCYMALEDQEVRIIYSGGGIGRECKGVPKGTVLAVFVELRIPGKLTDFKLKGERVAVFDSSTPPRNIYKAYYYVREGFIINTYQGKAFQLAYIATEKDIPRCPEYYDDPKGFVEIGAGHERLP